MKNMMDYRKLSEQELRIMEMFSNGNTLFEISEKMALSHLAVENYRVQMLQKLGARNMIHAVKLAAVKGLLNWTKEGQTLSEAPAI